MVLPLVRQVAQLGRFTLRDEGKTIAIGKVGVVCLGPPSHVPSRPAIGVAGYKTPGKEAQILNQLHAWMRWGSGGRPCSSMSDPESQLLTCP